MPVVYLASAFNHRGEKIPVFVHPSRLVVATFAHEWLRLRQKAEPSYWLAGIDITSVSWAGASSPQLITATCLENCAGDSP